MSCLLSVLSTIEENNALNLSWRKCLKNDSGRYGRHDLRTRHLTDVCEYIRLSS
jgi:hypothetical protein